MKSACLSMELCLPSHRGRWRSNNFGNAVRYRLEDVISFIENAACSFPAQDQGIGNE